MNHTKYFFVTSYGRTATVWLTRALNLHPDILCSHGPSLEPIIPHLGVPYTQESVVKAQNSASQFSAQSLHQILTSIRSQDKKARWVGNVHGFSASTLWLKRWTEFNIPPSHSINLLRHPIARIDSFCRRWEYERSFNSPITQWIATKAMQTPQYQNVIKELQDYHDVALESFHERAFFHAVMQMSTDDRDLRIWTTHIASERLVSDMDYFAYTLKILLGNTIDLPKEYLDSVEQLGRQNEAEGCGRTETQIFNEWQPWQRTLFFMFMRDHPKLKVRYRDFGYNLPQSDSFTTEIKEKNKLAQVLDSSMRDVTCALRGVSRVIAANQGFQSNLHEY